MVIVGNKEHEIKLTNQQLIKEANIKQVFDLIFKHKKISRAEIAHRTKLSPTTISTLVDELIASDLVISSGAGKSTTSGRKPIMLEVNKKRAQILCAGWKKKGFTYSLFDLGCNEIESFDVPLSSNADYAGELFSAIFDSAKLLDESKLLAVCISIPAIVDFKTKKIISTVLDIKKNNNFLLRTKDRFPDIPVVIGNESAFYAYAEKEFSLKKAVSNLIFININEGVGAGIVFGDEIFRGAYGMAGEFGHMSIDMNGPECVCGNRGCLERLVNRSTIMQRIAYAIETGGKSVVQQLTDNDLKKLNLKIVRQALENKDELVTDIIEDISRKVAFGINNIISIFNPEVVVLGGGIEELGPMFLDMVKANIKITGFRKLVSNVSIKYSKLTGNYENKGAAKYFMDNIFKLTINTGKETYIC